MEEVRAKLTMDGRETKPPALRGALGVIAEIAGTEAALRVSMRFRGTCIYVSSADEVVRRIRDERIRRDFDRGRPARQLALLYGLTVRHIRRILKA